VNSNHLTSGDLIADRRAAYARMLAEGGDHAAAAELMQQALELAPLWSAGWFLLGEQLEKAGLEEEAVKAYRRVLELTDEDIFGAVLKLSILGDLAQPDTPPAVYVEQLFDDYADRFEEALVEKLGYKVPGRLATLIAANGPAHYRLAVDLGCGTGLMGIELRTRVDRLEGYDLSANMLTKAREKAIYDLISQANLSLGLDEIRVVGPEHEAGRADLVAAADVLMYLGDLEPAFALAETLLAPRGRFAFSVEHLCESDGFRLQPSLRYAHSGAYVELLIANHGFRLVAREELVIRMDGGAPVNGVLFVAEKGGAA
jgi:predicted TPR repeat methyltransferase